MSYATSDVGAIVAKSATTPPGGTAVLADVDGNTSGYQINLGTGGTETVILVTVTAEGPAAGETAENTKIYTITVYRENLPLSDNALLDADAQDATAGLRLTNAEGTAPIDTGTPPTFSYGPRTKSYPDVRVLNDVGEVTVIVNPENLGAVAVITPSDQKPDNDASPGHQVLLREGAKTDITVVVTAEDGIATETYSITIYRERRPGAESSDATLSALNLSGVTLSPPFASAKGIYTGTAAFSTKLTTVSYMTSDVGARVAIRDPNGAMPGDLADDADNDPSNGHQIQLGVGEIKVIYLIVTAEGDGPDIDNTDADTKPYKITIYRDPAASSDASLLTLDLSGITLSPAFDPATTAYTAEVESLDTTMIEASAAHPGATVEGTGERALTVGENVISVTVTAEDETTETYTVTVTVGEAPPVEGDLLDRYDADDSGDIDKSRGS